MDGKKPKKAAKKAKSTSAKVPPTLDDTLVAMGAAYSTNPTLAVRSQTFIKLLHKYLGEMLEARFSKSARKRGVSIEYETTIYSSTKPKDVDVVVLDPDNGPLVIVGLRSQMSSVANNALTYYEGLVGECSSLQDRFPMAVHGYVYLHPLNPIKVGKEKQKVDHKRFARMYEVIAERDPVFYRIQRGVFDVFAYMIVDFGKNPPVLRDDILASAGLETDLTLGAFVDGIVSCFKQRELFIDLFS